MMLIQGYVVDRCPTLRQRRFTCVNFNRNLLVAPTFVKRRKLICIPVSFPEMMHMFRNQRHNKEYMEDCGL